MSVAADVLTVEQREYVEGLRQLADFLEQRPDLIPTYSPVGLDLFAYDVAEFIALSRRIGGVRSKEKAGSYFVHRRAFGPHRIDVNAAESIICERRVVGTREVPAELIEAHTEEIVEWVCPPTLAAESVSG